MSFQSKFKYIRFRHNQKPFVVMQIAVLLATAMLPLTVQAAQLENRSLQLSTSAAGATNVDYFFTFDTGTAGNIGSFVFEICSNDPFPNTSCTAPTGFAGAGATATVEIDSTPSSVDTVTTAGANDNEFTVVLVSPESSGLGDTVEVELSGITNPSPSNTEFWARIYTFSDTGATTEVDNGGVAFSTAETIEVTARVQETLSFCVYTEANCGAGGDLVDLGILNTSTIETADSFFDVATNARNGLFVQYIGDTLTSGTFDIDAFSGGDGNLAASNPGTEQFGLRVHNVTTGGQNALAAAPFDSAGANEYAFLVNDYQTVGEASGPVEITTFTIRYGANVAALTETGVYTTQIQYIATASF